MKKLDVFMYGLLIVISINALNIVHKFIKNNPNCFIIPSINDVIIIIVVLAVIGFISGVIYFIPNAAIKGKYKEVFK